MFGHGHNHSHNVPHLNEDEDDTESDRDSDSEDELESVKCIENETNLNENSEQVVKMEEPVVAIEQNPLVKLVVNDTNEQKNVKKRTRSNSPNKKARCHILCK